MSEENRNPGAELSEAKLEGVSGGATEAELAKAREFCAECQRNCAQYGRYCWRGSVERLAPYTGGMHDYYQCPFFVGPVG